MITCINRYLVIFAGTILLFVVMASYAQEIPVDASSNQQTKMLSTLMTLGSHQNKLRDDIKALEKQIKASRSETEKVNLQSQLNQLEVDLLNAQKNFEAISAGVEVDDFGEKPKSFDLQNEAMSLLEPIIKEMKEMTSDVRKKASLKENINFYNERLPSLRLAIKNLNALIESSSDPVLDEQLGKILEERQRLLTGMESELQASQFQLDKIVSAETSFAESSQSYLKQFFQKRGFYLAISVVIVIVVLLISRLAGNLMVRYLPGYRHKHRSFQIRVLDLSHRAITVILCIAGPMAVFYLAEDWVLFSLGVLLLLAIGWTLRTAVPRYWDQIKLFLNIGSVREGERIFYGGLPWEVKQINVFTQLHNPVAEISQRVAIEELVDMNSRPVLPGEPWFPCKKDDWVLLADGVRGNVTGISHEFVELVERGGARKTYTTQDFLANSPRNLSANFRLKETITIDYQHQKESTTTIPAALERYVQQRIQEEGYADDLLNLRVEFQEAGSSSLDLVVIADFKGEQAPLYNRLRRAIQRWGVDACTENNWLVPFPQLNITMHPEEEPSVL